MYMCVCLLCFMLIYIGNKLILLVSNFGNGMKEEVGFYFFDFKFFGYIFVYIFIDILF